MEIKLIISIYGHVLYNDIISSLENVTVDNRKVIEKQKYKFEMR